MDLMTDDQAVAGAEKEIDAAFEESPLFSLDYSQAMWTVLAVSDDQYFMEEHRRERAEMHALVEMDINAQTHPLRACFKQCKRSNKLVHRAYSKHDYDLGV
jgi:hypothetical protein